MDLEFTSADLRHVCSRRRAMIERWGPAHTDLIAQRLQELDAVERLGDLELLPYLRLAPGRGGRVVTVHGTDGVRIRVRPEVRQQSSPASKAWRQSTVVVVLDVDLTDP
jgi:hypothetical protein